MGLRPRAARWFELLTPTDSLAAAMEALASSGTAQVEAHGAAPPLEEFRGLAPRLEQYQELRRRFVPYLPNDGLRTSGRGAPRRLVDEGLERLGAWAKEAEPVIRALQAAEEERRELELLEELRAASSGEIPSFEAMQSAGPLLCARAVVLPPGARPVTVPEQVLRHRVSTERHTFLLLLGSPAQIQSTLLALSDLEPKSLELRPEGSIAPRSRELERALQARYEALEALHRKHDLRRAIADIRRLSWLVHSVPSFPHTEHFSVVTGWSGDRTGERLRSCLERDGVSGLLHFPPAPAGVEPPVILHNPTWARAFERFAALLGTPSRHESDPALVLAIVVPLLFGYMFGDVGHGLVLLGLGLLLRRRLPFLAVLAPAGISSAFFGVIFGSIFCMEQPISPLWTHPLERPLPVLVGSLVMGALVLLLGVLLSALGSIWQARFPFKEVSLILVAVGAAVSAFDPRAALLAVAGLLLQAAASAVETTGPRARAALAGAAELFERTIQLFINTVSFARVGAFALAHAGLCSAMVTLSQSTTNWVGRVTLLALGNLLVLVLEGLVVSIQTTRLVLFEFFARFLRAEGRVFRPLAPPAESST